MGRVRRLPEPKTGSSNPFVYDIEYTPWMRFKLLTGALIMFPIRLLLSFIIVPIVLICVRLGGMGWKTGQHLKPWQKFLMLSITPRVVRAWTFLVFGYYTITVKGKRAKLSEAPIVIITPHSHVMDSWMLSLFCWGSSMSRRENENLPILGTCLKSCEPIWVDRTSAKGKSVVDEVISRVTSPGQWIPVVIFPEGTVHNTEAVIGFKTGAFRPGVPVQPVLLRYAMPAIGIWSHFGHSLPMTLLLVMCKWSNDLEVEYLPPYNPSEEEKKDAQLYAMNVRDVVAKELDKPKTDYALEDLRLVQWCFDAGLPNDAGLVEYNMMSRVFNVRLSDLKVIVERFISMNTSKSGVVSCEEFLSYLQWPVQDHAQLLFTEYDTCSDNGRLRFREYAVGTFDLVMKVPGGDSIASQAYKALSGGGNKLSASSMFDYMQRHGHSNVSKDSVEKFLYKMSQSHDLSESGLSAYLEGSPDLKVLLFWLLNGTDKL
ncbi:lysophosphatidylcholine acyltransferase 2-like [Sycon ciliatum]|uniref:lysophosphatidylcholine acyltransferase 2-like n=1 Tax=Sycon ciliatum TaxID=27933 RepID=UPI0031F61297